MKKKTSTSRLKKLKKAKAESPKSVSKPHTRKEDKEVAVETVPPVPTLDATEAPKKKIRPRDKVHYVNSREFEEEIRVYYNTGKISEKLGESLTKIANGLSYAPNFINYSYKDDMIGDAIVKMFSALRNKKFRLDSGFSPFSYFTTIAFHAFINRIKKEKKHHQALTEYKEKVYTETMAKKDEDGNCYIYIEPLDENYNQED
jgi:hypothetical protein